MHCFGAGRRRHTLLSHSHLSHVCPLLSAGSLEVICQQGLQQALHHNTGIFVAFLALCNFHVGTVASARTVYIQGRTSKKTLQC